MNAQPYDFTLTASGSQRLDVVGSSFKLLSSTGPIEVKSNTGARLVLQPGQGIRRFEFESLTISNKSGALNVGTILIAGSDGRDAEMIDDRITGEVSVIDGGRARTIAGAAFIASGVRGTPAGLHPVITLWNPSATKTVTVKSLMISSSVDASVAMGFVAVTTGGKQGFSTSKKAPGAAGITEVWNDENAAYPYAIAFHTSYVKAGESFLVSLAEPIVLPPSNGLAVASSSMVVGALMTVSAEVIEE